MPFERIRNGRTLNFFGIRSIVMKNAMRRLKELPPEEATNEAFSRIVKEEWEIAKQTAERLRRQKEREEKEETPMGV